MKNKIIAVFDSEYDAKNAVRKSREKGYKLSRVSMATKNNENDLFYGDAVPRKAGLFPHGSANANNAAATVAADQNYYGFLNAPAYIGFNVPNMERYDEITHEVQPGKTVLSLLVEEGQSHELANFIKGCGAERIMDKT